MSAPRLSVVIPTYNEAENVPVLLERLAGILSAAGVEHEVIVVDDDSPDRTWQVAESLRARFPHVRVIRRTSSERGLAPAVVEGWRAAQGELLGVMDADLQHPPEVLTKLLEAFADPGVDLAIASRYTLNGRSRGLSPIRKWLSRGASNLAQAVLPAAAHGVTDPMSGYFMLRRRVVEQVELRPKGYKILLEVLGRGRYRRVVDVPFEFGRRTRGESKLGANVMRDYLQQLWHLAWAPTGFGRFVRFCLVGATGVLVNLGFMWWLKGSGLLGTLRAGVVAVEASILNNFLWNELWTFKDRSRLDPRLSARLRRLAYFNLICGVGAMFQVGILWLLAIRLGWHYLLATAMAIGVVTFWNYGLNTTWTWTRLAGVPAQPVSRRREPSRSAGRLVIALVLGWLALQGWLVGTHWINADEGAHLMDAQLAMQGLIPEVDFHARQPLYVYAYVPFLALFGGGFVAGRLMPVLATALTAWMLFLIGRRLWSRAVGAGAALLFLYTPTIFVNAAVVKTEPLVILLTCLGLYGVAAHLQGGRRWPLILAGASLGAGYYVRESSLAGVLAAGLLMLWAWRDGIRALARRLGLFGLGYGAVVAGVLLAYARRLPVSELFSRGSLSPLAAVSTSLGHILGWMPRAEAAAGPVRQSSQWWFETVDRLLDATRLNLHLLAGVAAAAALWWGLRKVPGTSRGYRVALVWSVSITALYAYHVLHRGFFQYYFRELIPPMALLTACAVAELLRQMETPVHHVRRLAVIVLGSALAAWGLERFGWKAGVPLALGALGVIGWEAFRATFTSRRVRARYVLGCVAVLAGLLLVRFTPLAGGPYPKLGLPLVILGFGLVLGLARLVAQRWSWRAAGTFTGLSAVGTALILSAAYAGPVATLSYDCDWPPNTVAAVARTVAAHSAPQDEVLSGAVIWELEAGRRPFQRISHPLGFMEGMSAEERRSIAEGLVAHPPRVIVMDQYTQWTYGRYLPLEPLLASSYRLVGEFTDARWPVRVYARRGEAPSR